MEPTKATGRMGMGKLAFASLAALPFAFLAAAAVAGDGIPFSAIRLRKPQTDSPEVWQATLGQFAKHRAGVDEVWFSTGICFPKMEEHRAAARRLATAAEDLRKLGILPSLQIQATIGHGDAFIHYADNSGMTWQGFTSENGAVAKGCNCFRAPAFLAYMREMASLYAAAVKPYAVWVDDDSASSSTAGPVSAATANTALGSSRRRRAKSIRAPRSSRR